MMPAIPLSDRLKAIQARMTFKATIFIPRHALSVDEIEYTPFSGHRNGLQQVENFHGAKSL
jgi:hypothetical protein